MPFSLKAADLPSEIKPGSYLRDRAARCDLQEGCPPHRSPDVLSVLIGWCPLRQVVCTMQLIDLWWCFVLTPLFQYVPERHWMWLCFLSFSSISELWMCCCRVVPLTCMLPYWKPWVTSAAMLRGSCQLDYWWLLLTWDADDVLIKGLGNTMKVGMREQLMNVDKWVKWEEAVKGGCVVWSEPVR